VTGCPIDLERWSTKFDHFDPDYTDEPYPFWAALRDQCPVMYSELYGGFWVALRHEDMKRVAHDPGTFSSRKVNIPDQWDFSMPPVKVDPPDHTRYRRMLQSAFSATEAARWEATIRQIAEDLIDDFGERTEIDASEDYARNLPLAVTCKLLGIKDPDRELFSGWMHKIFDGSFDPQSALGTLGEMNAYLQEVVAEHRAAPRDDLTTLLINAEVDGQKLSEEDLVGAAWLLFVAGIDTTWGTLGCSIVHLADHPDDRRRLIDAMTDPESTLWSTAVEEYLRAFAPASMAREVVQDVELGGHQLRKGQLILLPFPAANRDPAVFDRPDEVVLDRTQNNHAAFGMGIHRCLGLHFARLEMQIGLQTFLRRIPDFSLKAGAKVTYAPGQVRGPRSIPIVLDHAAAAAR
jgi:cytochrome P450